MIGTPKGDREKASERNGPQPIISAIIDILSAFQGGRNNDHAAEKQKKSNERMMARWTKNVGLFTFALVVIGIITAIIFNRQLGVMQGQLDAMADNQRPWLRVEAFPEDLSSFLPSEKNPYPTLFFSPHFKITNIGKSPAFSAQLVLLGYAITPEHNDPNAGQKDTCERERKVPSGMWLEFGNAISGNMKVSFQAARSIG